LANHLYPLGKQRILEGSIAALTDTLKLAMVTSAYVESDAHQWFSDLAGVVGTPVALASKTTGVPTGGVLNAASVTFPSVASGSTVVGLVIYKDTGVAGTSPLIAWYDTKGDSTAISIVTNGGDITINWSTGASRVFQL
jgi:hypothetical protein